MDDQVTGPGTASQDRCPALEIAQDRDGHDQGLTAAEVAADDAGAAGLAALCQPLGKVPHPGHRGRRRHDETDDERNRAGSHGSGVGEVLGSGPRPDVAPCGPLGAEVVPLDQDIGAHRRARVGEGQDGAVVPGADRGLRATRQERGNNGEELLLAEVPDPHGPAAGRSRISD